MARYIKINPNDNVAVALTDLGKGETIPQCGSLVIAEDEPMGTTAAAFIDAVLQTVSGKPVKSEEHGIREIAIFKTGVTL